MPFVIGKISEVAQIYLALIGVDVNPNTFKIEMSPILAEDEVRTMQILGDEVRSPVELNRPQDEMGIKPDACMLGTSTRAPARSSVGTPPLSRSAPPALPPRGS